MQRENILKMLHVILSELDVEMARDPRQKEALTRASEHISGVIRALFQAPEQLPLFQAMMDTEAYVTQTGDTSVSVYAELGSVVDVFSISRDFDGQYADVTLNGRLLRVPMNLLVRIEKKDDVS